MEGTLVFGGTGFLGAWVVAVAHGAARELATFADPQGAPVWGVGRQPGAAPRFSDPRDGARWESLDLAGTTDLRAWLGSRSPQTVIHCAALSRVGECEQDPGRAELLNSEVPARIAAWCAESAARFVHVSTDLVFGTSAPDGGFTEDAEPSPLSVYGRTKAMGEEAVLAANPDALVVRLPLLYGNSGGRGLGATDALLQAVDRGERPGMFVDEWRTPLEVSNAAEALVELSAGTARGLLHVAGPERLSRYALATRALEAMGLPPNEAAACVVPTPREEAAPEVWSLRPPDVALNAAAARRQLETDLLGVGPGLRRAVG